MSNKETFKTVEPNRPYPSVEQGIIEHWKSIDVFSQLKKKMEGGEPYVFCEGPPTANGEPSVGHALTRAIKDVFLRYQVMNGKKIVPFKAGWDCHGLPVEIAVEKQLGINSKDEIEKYGIAKFNSHCHESVLRYKKSWENMSERIAFWIDYENPYITMEDNYIESVWASLKDFYDKKLLFKGHYVVPYCPRCGTPLSSHEVAQGFKEVSDPSIFVRFKIRGEEDRYLLAWTTTPWTLISNLLLTVKEDADYAEVKVDGSRYILAEALVKSAFDEFETIGKMKGADLKGMEYEPLFTYMTPASKAHYVTTSNFVTLDDGTGIVHIAPAYGVDDYELCKREGVTLVNAVDEKGLFKPEIGEYAGVFVKHADRHIIKELKGRGDLIKSEKIKHTYPFCWRCDSPLLYYALDSWFIAASKNKEKLKEQNEKVNWKPEHLKHGRFGNFLDELKDWALSRNRYWGTPLPIWNCECGHQECVGSKQKLVELSGSELPGNFELHRPYVDEIKLNCPKCQKVMKRETYVIDCWYDSGCAPFAQYHYPFENKKEYDENPTMDFISEAIDQTRGWFYTLHAISTMRFARQAYKNCLTMGLVLDEKGQKMSKSRGNAVSPDAVFDSLGADVIRLYFYLTPAWNSVRFSDRLVRENGKRPITTLWNVYSFFVSNANIDGFKPDPDSKIKSGIPADMDILDRWLLSRLSWLDSEVTRGLTNFEVHKSAKAFTDFVEEVSNWYLRRSRRRFWEEGLTKEKEGAYNTMYFVFDNLSKIIAPMLPFFSEEIHLNIVKPYSKGAKESVHFESRPPGLNIYRNEGLEEKMKLTMDMAESGRNLRQKNGIKLRQPLSELIVAVENDAQEEMRAYAEIAADELNVKSWRVISTSDSEKLGNSDDYVRSEVGGVHILLNKVMSEELRFEGLAREVVRRIQNQRKEMKLDYTDSIELKYNASPDVETAMEKFKDYIAKETLSKSMTKCDMDGGVEFKIQKEKLTIDIAKV